MPTQTRLENRERATGTGVVHRRCVRRVCHCPLHALVTGSVEVTLDSTVQATTCGVARSVHRARFLQDAYTLIVLGGVGWRVSVLCFPQLMKPT